MCTPDGTIFDVEVISAWLEKHDTNPVDGKPLAAKDLIRLVFARNADVDSKGGADGQANDGKGDLIDPVTFKVFTDNTHIVAIRHGSYANVFAWDTIERMNIKPKMWRDLVDDVEFTRKDIITLQDPQNVSAGSRDLSQFKYLRDGGEALLTKEQEEERKEGNVNVDALGRVGDKLLRAKEAVERARRERQQASSDVNRSAGKALVKPSGASSVARKPAISDRPKPPPNAAVHTTGRTAASFTSTGLTPSTTGERALLTDEEYMLTPKRVQIKGYVRIVTNLGVLGIELHTESAPRTVWNFIRLAQRGYYDNVTFHRNIKNFMIQGGDPTGTGRGGQSIWGKNFADEGFNVAGAPTHSSRGTVSMANKGKDTNSSQFFITYRATPHLDRKHTVFGRVVEGHDVLDKMEDVPVDGSDRPLNKIVIKSVEVLIDPFEEFLKQKTEKEGADAAKEALRRKRREDGAATGLDDDEHTTWTGKRVRDDGTVIRTKAGSGPEVGKYLKAALSGGDGTTGAGDAVDDSWAEPEPVKKKQKAGGFGNFDNW